MPHVLPHSAQDTFRMRFRRLSPEETVPSRSRRISFLKKRLQGCSLLACVALLVTPRPGEASLQCYQCHGTQTPADYRPLDSSTRNPATGGFQGNHRTHMGGAATPSTCNKCHPDSDTKTSTHRTGIVTISSRINGSPLPTAYRNGTTAWQQTAEPSLGDTARCTNVNCHFETVTPVWGGPPLASPAGCSVCHGAPPAGNAPPYAGGTAGSHPKHDLYYPGPLNCARCHTDHAVEPAPFAHATSVGSRPVTVEPRDFRHALQGNYSAASGNDHLPSQAQSHQFGACSNTYCHSDGTSTATGTVPHNRTPNWGSGTTSCSSCHGFPPAYPNGVPKMNTHGKHPFSCGTCHSATTADGTTITGYDRHVNGDYDVIPGPGVSFTYVFSAAGGTCSEISCHNNGTAVWGSTLTCGNCHAVSPGGD